MTEPKHSNIESSDDDFIAPEIIQGFIDKFNKVGLYKRHTSESLSWFRRRVSKDLRFNRQRLIKDYGDYKRRSGKENKTLVGRLYYFHYQAEEAGDRENNVYDAYPMVFIFNTSLSNEGKKLIHALNVHYLQPKEKALLYLKLMKVRNKKGWTQSTKLKLSWDIIKQLVNHKIYEKAVHTYRVDRIKSKLIEIHADQWEIACFLQLSQWIHVDGDNVDQAAIRASRR